MGLPGSDGHRFPRAGSCLGAGHAERAGRAGTHHCELQLSTSYQDAVDRLRDGRVDASFLGAWIHGHLATREDMPALAKADINISVAARLLGLPRSTLRSKLDKEG